MSDVLHDLRHEAGMMPDWRDSTGDDRLIRRLAVHWPGLLLAAAAEIARLRAELAAARADLALAREREGAAGLEYRGG